MITMRNFLLHCASQSAMNTVHYLNKLRFGLVSRKKYFTLDDKIHTLRDMCRNVVWIRIRPDIVFSSSFAQIFISIFILGYFGQDYIIPLFEKSCASLSSEQFPSKRLASFSCLSD